MGDADQQHRAHQTRSSGSKFKKKQEKKQKKHVARQSGGEDGDASGKSKFRLVPDAAGNIDLEAAKQRNPKAFINQSGRNALKAEQRRLEKEQRRLHVPLVDRSIGLEPPPIMVAVVGPPKVGKTTLIKSLIRKYTKQTLSDVQGPVTVVSGRKRRITFFECGNDINSMTDVAKTADLVLLLVDASFGFEMARAVHCLLLYSNGMFRKRLSSSTSARSTVSLA